MPDINGIPYVESSDLVSAYPAASQALAQEVSDQLASKLDLAGGKILQIVRATDSTQRTTTSTSFVDADISVTITPQKSNSAILLIWTANVFVTGTDAGTLFGRVTITDNSNNSLVGNRASIGSVNITITGTAENLHTFTLVGYSTPATTSATTYKGRMLSGSASTTMRVRNDEYTGQLYAIEVSA